MEQANVTDTYRVYQESIFSSNEVGYLLDFYAPILGLKTISIYLGLRNERSGESHPHSEFYLKYQISEGEFFNALEALEAIGLVVTYRLKKSEGNSFAYAIYSPRGPKEFFSNELLVGTLRRFIGEQRVDAIVSKYRLEPLPEGYENISKKFMDYFQLDPKEDVYHSITASIGGSKYAPISLYFDKKKFLDALKEELPAIKENTLSQAEYTKVARFAALYAFDEEAIASLTAQALRLGKDYGERVDFPKLSQLCLENDSRPYMHRSLGKNSEIHGNSGIAQMVRAMDSLSAVDFLSKLQKGGKPASSDLKLINTLVGEMGLPENVCNALVFYVLQIKENVLNASYVEKLAGSLVREGCLTAIDALNYLGKTGSSLKKRGKKEENKKTIVPKKEKKEEPVEEKPVVTPSVAPTEEDEEEDDYEALLESL